MSGYDDEGIFYRNNFKFSDNGGIEENSKLKKLSSFIGENELYSELLKKYGTKDNINKNLYTDENYNIIKKMAWQKSKFGTRSCIAYAVIIISILAIILIVLFLDGKYEGIAAIPTVALWISIGYVASRYYRTRRMINNYERKNKED